MNFPSATLSRRMAMAIGVMLAAFACGHLMQSGLLTRSATLNATPDAATTIRDAGRTPSLPVPPAATLRPMELPAPGSGAVETLTDSAFTPDLRQNLNISPFGLPCDETLVLQHMEPALLELTLSAPCRPGEEVRLFHDSLTLTERTDSFGILRLRLPAMARDGHVAVRFADNVVVEAAETVPDLKRYSRVALTWTGDAVFGLRALEPNAREVSTVVPGAALRAVRGAGGFLAALGTERRAAVYTYPNRAQFGGRVRFTLDAAVTADVCGEEIVATAYQPGAIGGYMSRTFTVEFPDCSKVGQVLSLESPFRDMRIARR